MLAYCGWIGWRDGCGERCRMHERLRTAGERSFPSLISLVVSVDVKHHVYYGERKIKRVNLLKRKRVNLLTNKKKRVNLLTRKKDKSTNKNKGKSTDKKKG